MKARHGPLIPIVTDEWYHILDRGNDRNSLFRDAADYRAFAQKLEPACAKHRVGSQSALLEEEI